MKKEPKKEPRIAYLLVDGEELRRIVENNLGGITFKAEVFHSRIVLSATTGENEKVKAYQ